MSYPKKPVDARDWYSVREAAEFLGVRPETVARWIKAGRLPARRVGPRCFRIDKAAVADVAAGVEVPHA